MLTCMICWLALLLFCWSTNTNELNYPKDWIRTFLNIIGTCLCIFYIYIYKDVDLYTQPFLFCLLSLFNHRWTVVGKSWKLSHPVAFLSFFCFVSCTLTVKTYCKRLTDYVEEVKMACTYTHMRAHTRTLPTKITGKRNHRTDSAISCTEIRVCL